MDAFGHQLSQQNNTSMLAAMTVGSLFNHIARFATFSLGASAGRFGAALNLLSYGTALGSEALAFETTHRALESLSAHPSHANLWNWNGSGGLKEGFVSTLFTIGSLKAFGRMAQGQSIATQHLFSDLGMVASQNVLGLATGNTPQGNIFSQLAHAEVVRMQLAVGGQLMRRLLPSVSVLERNLESTNQRYSSLAHPESGRETHDLLQRLSSNNDGEDGKTVADGGIFLRMQDEKEAHQARQLEELWRSKDGTVIHSDSLMKYLRYQRRTSTGPTDERIALRGNVSLEIMQELHRRGVSLDEFARPYSHENAGIRDIREFFPQGDGDTSNQNAVMIDVRHLNLSPPAVAQINPVPVPVPVEGSTLAISSTGLLGMLEGINPVTPGAQPAPAAPISPVVATPPSRFPRLARVWEAVTKPFRNAPPSPLPPALPAPRPTLSTRAPFTLTETPGVYNYYFPVGTSPVTVGRVADHSILGDPNLSAVHVTVQRRIEPGVTAYVLTAHKLVVIHRADGTETNADNGRNTWLNPGDRVHLTPHFSFIFRPF